jgi:dihydrofolate reductase
VIGVDGGIPWRLPEDRKLFKNLTRQRILIIGRKTFEEHPTLVHVDHTKFCIVISNSMEDLPAVVADAPVSFHLARSFSEALDIAREVSESDADLSSSDDESNHIACWIAGGEFIYEQALKHRSVEEVHLSVVDLEVDYWDAKDVAMFPAKYRWDHKFEIPSCTEFPSGGESPGFSYFLYKRKQKHA